VLPWGEKKIKITLPRGKKIKILPLNNLNTSNCPADNPVNKRENSFGSKGTKQCFITKTLKIADSNDYIQ